MRATPGKHRAARLILRLTLGLLAASLAANAQEPTRSLTLSLNQESFRPGETLVLTATVTPGAPRPVDVYLILEPPDGRPWLFYQADGGFTDAPQPLVRNWTVAPFTGVLFSRPLSGCELGGAIGGGRPSPSRAPRRWWAPPPRPLLPWTLPA
jgi:hypothetical protein